MQRYDIIGDIHGHADELEALLSRLGYLEIAGRYCHPGGRKVIFLGDYLDRGPKIRRVLQIVRAMVDEGDGLAILGNHEINALRYHTLDRDGQPLRAHTAANRRQHEATLSQLATAHSGEWREWQRWLGRLPLSLDLGDLRIVHAAWEDAAVLELSKIGCWEGEALERYSIKGSPGHSVISRVVNGPEARLPHGHKYPAADGTFRREIRVRWWKNLRNASYREAIFPPSEAVPDWPMSDPGCHDCGDYSEEAAPVFFGHYAVHAETPAPLQRNLACLDYGTGKGGFLCAYRWDGEHVLDASSFVTIRTRRASRSPSYQEPLAFGGLGLRTTAPFGNAGRARLHPHREISDQTRLCSGHFSKNDRTVSMTCTQEL